MCSLNNSLFALLTIFSLFLCLQKMKEYSGDGESDHLMRVALYQGWEEQQKAGRQSGFSYVQSHHLSILTLQFIRGNQHEGLLYCLFVTRRALFCVTVYVIPFDITQSKTK